jgi:hypothetical protein
MANRDRLHGNDTGFVTLFVRAPQLCAAALAGLASALWLNVVGPFAGLVAAWGALILVNALAVSVVCNPGGPRDHRRNPARRRLAG